jgi:hypothetical protein
VGFKGAGFLAGDTFVVEFEYGLNFFLMMRDRRTLRKTAPFTKAVKGAAPGFG